MGIKRIIDTSFWTDSKVVDLFTPEDKLFYLYLMTNPHTTQLGIYQINKKLMSFELGLPADKVEQLLKRFQDDYKMIMFSEETSEVAIKHYLRHSIIKGGKPVEDLLISEVRRVKDDKLLEYVFSGLMEDRGLNTTVLKVISRLQTNENENDNENDNDNEKSSHRYDGTYRGDDTSPTQLSNLFSQILGGQRC